MDVDQDQLDAYAAVGIGREPIGLGERPALLVIDLQRAYVTGKLASPQTEEVLDNTRRLLEAARASGMPVYHARVVYDDPSEAGVAFAAKCPSTLTCLRGAEETGFHPTVAPLDDERVIEKRRASAFFQTSLDEELRAAGIDTVIMAGTSTSGCVRASAVDASSLDYRVTVVEDCVDDRAPASHVAALTDLHAKYADVVSLEELVPLIGAADESVPR